MDAQRQLMTTQSRIDTAVMENMGKMGKIVDNLNDVTLLMVKSTGAFLDLFSAAGQKFTKMISDPKAAALDWLKENVSGETEKILKGLLENAIRKMGENAAEIARARQAAPASPSNPTPQSVPPNPSAPGNTTGQNPPENAMGGLVTSPSIVGENGPEAVIPLARGSIPMNIDFAPLIRSLDKQAYLMEQVVRNTEDTRDLQRQILSATY